MGKINILQSHIYNKIAAGEVAERPSSVVKELVENSIDAGAAAISVAIKNGGLLSILVSDNGCGMDREDAQKAFLPHATSKVKDEEDLFSIKSLGFRGEALASIAAVSKVELITRTQDAEVGTKVWVEDGASTISDCGSSKGTRITVNNLFYNTPARFKFLRKPRTEAAEITNLISKFILCNPDISFSYTIDDQVIFENTGKGLEHAIFTVYGKDALNSLIPLKNKYKNISIHGYISRPDFTKSNSTYQTQVVNGRWITSSTISAAVTNAYRDYLMPRNFPLYVLNIELPHENIDVNVHPNKSDVRFSENGEIFSAVYNTVKRAIESLRQEETAAFTEMIEQRESNTFASPPLPRQESVWHRPVVSMGYAGHLSDNDNALKSFYAVTEERSDTIVNVITEENIDQAPETLKIIGQLFQTYIIIEYHDRFSIIDQHAAHERLLYDKYEQQLAQKNIYTQGLLVPYTLTLTPSEFAYISERLDIFTQAGFDISPFGNLSFVISSVPYILSTINFEKFFRDILSGVKTGGEIKLSDAFRHYLMQKACKAAVKEGDVLNIEEIKSLLSAISQDKPELYCPHGRPILREFRKTDLEKWFKRI